MAPYVAQQLAAAVAQGATETTQISLNPEELGRVRITLTTAEGGLLVSILAERPETADLMRRNIDALMKEFSDLGYDNPTFSFDGQDGATEKEETRRNTAVPQSETIEPPATELKVNRQVPNGGLNIKL